MGSSPSLSGLTMGTPIYANMYMRDGLFTYPYSILRWNTGRTKAMAMLMGLAEMKCIQTCQQVLLVIMLGEEVVSRGASGSTRTPTRQKRRVRRRRRVERNHRGPLLPGGRHMCILQIFSFNTKKMMRIYTLADGESKHETKLGGNSRKKGFPEVLVA